MEEICTLVFRNTANRKDAAYVIKAVHLDDHNYRVTGRYGSWKQYRNATLNTKVYYEGPSNREVQIHLIQMVRKRLGRNYEFQPDLSSSVPAYLANIIPNTNTRTRVIPTKPKPVPPPTPDPRVQTVGSLLEW